jgi:hypothetical protein
MFRYSKDDHKKWFCKRCLTPQYSEIRLKNHLIDCGEHKIQQLIYPTENDKHIYFNNYINKLEVPIVIYADFECLLSKVEGPLKENGEDKISNHVPCGFAYKVVCASNKEYDKDIVLYRGPDAIEQFIKSLLKEEEYVNQVKLINKPMVFDKNKVTDTCYVCDELLSSKNEKIVRDHNHLSSEFRGLAHNSCNINFRYKKYIPVIFHNLKGYDSHLIIQEISKFMDNYEVSIIPQSTEKFISFSIGNFRFIDSYSFMASSLDKLVKNLTGFKYVQEPLLQKKVIYPYEYMSDFDKFNEDALPNKESFYSELSESNITDLEYEHAIEVFNKYCKNLGDYHDLYLKTDVLLLVEVFESFRQVCLRYYNLDPAHYYTTPGLAWDALLKKTSQRLELLTDPDMYLMIEKGIRGGISTVSSKRHVTANNKYLSSYNENEKSNYIVYLDANNLYGWAMSQSIPTHGFKWCTTDEYQSLRNDQSNGFVFEVDLAYPVEIHDEHNDYPLAPQKLKVTKDMLSDYQKAFDKKSSDSCKLIPNLKNKEKYVVHIDLLHLYMSLGIKVTKVHRIITFKQSPWMKPYIDFNTQKRTEDTNDFDKDFFKLLNNSVFGKSIENIRKRKNYQLINNPEKRDKLVKQSDFCNMIIYNENLVGIERTKQKLKANKPLICGFSILDKSKFLMYDFHYNYMLKKYPYKLLKLLYTDTDSLIYDIETDDVYEDFYNDKDKFDNSDYSRDNKFYFGENKKVIGKMKDECAGKPIQEFIGLKSKMYCVKVENKEIKKAKGIKKTAVNKYSIDTYKEVLKSGLQESASFQTIKSKCQNIGTYNVTKKSLIAYDDKRYYTDNNNSLAYGHYSIKY